jgi:2'-5' RNA ligase
MFESTASHDINYFFALLPDAHATAAIVETEERLRRAHRLSGTSVGAQRLHLSLSPTGRPERLRQSLEASLVAAAGEVREQAFEVTLDTAMHFSARDNRCPFVLCVDGATAASALKLRKAIAEAQLHVGLYVTGVSSFLPHVTLLYGHAIEMVRTALPPIRWMASEFVLVRSFFGQSRHEVVGRWALQAAGTGTAVTQTDEDWSLPDSFDAGDPPLYGA